MDTHYQYEMADASMVGLEDCSYFKGSRRNQTHSPGILKLISQISGNQLRHHPLYLDIDRALDRSLVASLVVAVLLIPLIVLPESEFTSITNLPKVTLLRAIAGAIVVILGLKVTVNALAVPGHGDARSLTGDNGYISLVKSKSAIWIPAGATIVFLGTLISTVFSIHIESSLLGIDPGESHRDLYSSSAYFVIFAGTVLAARSFKTVNLIVIVLAVSGTISALIGALQYFGFAPFGIGGTFAERLTGTAGNPIFFGSILVAAFPFVVISLVEHGRNNGYYKVHLMVLTVTSSVFVFAATGTASRAVLIAFVVVFAVTILGFARELGLKKTYPLAGSLVIASLIAITVNLLIPSDVKGLQQQSTSDDSLYSALYRNRLDPDHLTGISNDRLSIWSTSMELIVDRPDSGEWRSAPAILRHLVGYGPDTFRYTNQFAVDDDRINVNTSHAHNEWLNRWVELGLVGIVSWIFLWVAAIGTASFLLIRSPGSKSQGFIPVAIVGSLAGTGIMQMTGIPQPGDTILFWVILGLLTGLAIRAIGSDSKPAGTFWNSMRRPEIPPIVVVLAISIIGLTIFWTWSENTSYLQASVEARNGIGASEYGSVVRKLERSINLAPGVIEYSTILGSVLTERASKSVDPIEAAALRQKASETYLQALSERPFDRSLNYEAAQAAWISATVVNQSPALDAIRIYEKLAKLAPNDSIVAPRLKAMRDAVGLTEGQ